MTETAPSLPDRFAVVEALDDFMTRRRRRSSTTSRARRATC